MRKLRHRPKPDQTYTLHTTSVDGSTQVQYGLLANVVKHWLAAYLIDETVVAFYVVKESGAVGACTCAWPTGRCPVHPNVPKLGVSR